jgi:hypothetical protein
MATGAGQSATQVGTRFQYEIDVIESGGFSVFGAEIITFRFPSQGQEIAKNEIIYVIITMIVRGNSYLASSARIFARRSVMFFH